MEKFHSHGKLLISGEYVVLDGATALALPTKFGQSLEVRDIDQQVIKWKSLDKNDQLWFQETFKIKDLLSENATEKRPEEEVFKMLFLTLISAARMNPEHLKKGNGFEITAKTEFPRDWGLGTSSTLIANIARWCKIDAFKLLEATFGGSGYDVAVALQGAPITFQKLGAENSILRTSFDPPFKNHLFFVHLNQKQNSRESIKVYREKDKETLDTSIEKISSLTHSMITCTNLIEFNLLLEVHENVISQLLGLKKVKKEFFPEYPGAIKSLGGWGGDFILATGGEKEQDYFRKKGYSTILPFSEMILR